jgi:hypothetical protein
MTRSPAFAQPTADSGIAVPRFSDYAPRPVTFTRAHPEIGSAGMA